jgi:beta-N-acetylhexosaminidase
VRRRPSSRVFGTAAAASLAVLASLAASACARPATPASAAGGSHDVSPAARGARARSDPPTLPAIQAADVAQQSSVIAKLGERQLAGQRVVYSYPGLTPPASLLSAIETGHVGGVIFFSVNISSRAQIAGVIKQLEAANASPQNPARQYPLLLMTDQEGGEVRRLPGAPVLSEKQIGEIRPISKAEAAATSAGKGAAANLLGVGMNVNLAPVLDVYRKAGDFDDQYQRSYSKNPHVVSALGYSFIKAQQAGGVAATAKHFPGLGAASASQNTDVRPVTINLPAATLRSVDEYPYRAAIKAGVKLVMVSWAAYPKLDPSRLPAGLSSKIVQGELRQRLGFTGVTITDSIGAGALAPYGSTQNRCVLASKAGMEVLLAASQAVSQGTACADGLFSEYTHDNAAAKKAFQAVVAQILALRQGLPA